MLFAALSGDEITFERVGQHTGLEHRLASKHCQEKKTEGCTQCR